MADPRIGDSPHDLLLALAGRLDDDLLAWCRELVAVGEDERAVELACAALAADRAALPPTVRAALVAAARAARTDLDADTALPPAAGTGVPHRFDAALPVVDELAAAVAGLPGRQVAGCRFHVTARTTPAGAAPGPLPQPVVLAEVAADDGRPLDVLAYRLATACERAGVTAAVEVVVAGTALPPYQRAALRTARPVEGDRPASAPARRAAPAASPPAALPRTEPPPAAPPRAEPLPAAAPVPEPVADPVRGTATEPTPAAPSVPAESAAAEPPVRDPAPVEPVEAEPAAAQSPPAQSPPAEPPPAEPAAAPPATEPPAGRRAARRAGPRSSLADRMAAWDALDAAAPADETEPVPAEPAAAPGPDDLDVRDDDDRVPDRDPAGSEPADEHPGPGAAAGHDDLEQTPAPARPEPAPFGRVDSGPVSFEPTSADPVVDDERPRWPATGSLVLPRRRPAVPQPAAAEEPAEPTAPADEEAAPAPVRRPTAVRPLRAAPETGGRRRLRAPVEEPPQDAVVRPLRPAPPDAPAPAAAADPATGPLTVPVPGPEPEPVIDEDDPLGLGRMPLSREEPSHRSGEPQPSGEPAADPWSDDWRTGDWAVPPRPAAEDPAPAAGPDPAPAPVEPGPLLRPETAARLNDEDRELLARLQAELGAGTRPRSPRRTGVTPDGRSPSRPSPPDLAG